MFRGVCGNLKAAVAAAFLLGGCSSTYIDPPSADLRANENAVLLILQDPSPVTPSPSAEGLARGAGGGARSGAVQGAMGGAGLMMAGCEDSDSCLFAIVLGIAVMPITALAGGVIGAIRARSDEEVEAAARSFEAALRNDARQALLAAVVRKGERLTGRRFVIPEDDAAVPARNPGPGLMMVISKADLDFASEGEIDPDVTLTLQARMFLRQPGAVTSSYWRDWLYQSEPHGYFDLAASDGAKLKAEIDRAVNLVAERMVHDTFVSQDPEKLGKPVAGTVVTTGGSRLRTE